MNAAIMGCRGGSSPQPLAQLQASSSTRKLGFVPPERTRAGIRITQTSECSLCSLAWGARGVFQPLILQRGSSRSQPRSCPTSGPGQCWELLLSPTTGEEIKTSAQMAEGIFNSHISNGKAESKQARQISTVLLPGPRRQRPATGLQIPLEEGTGTPK